MRKLPVEFHPDARLEALAAHDWYEDRSPNAADAFHASLESAGQAIADAPDRWATYLFGTRRYLMKQFPFAIVYRVAANRIEILAVAHGRQKPGYWRDRMKSA